MLRVSTVFLIMIGLGLGSGSPDTVLVPAGSTWSYLDDGSDQGSAWREPGFVDTAWASGSAQLGYGDGDEATVVGYGPDPNNKYVTTYFRHSFEVGDPSQSAVLKLRLLRDDGAVVYLNGFEVERPNMPGGVIDYLTLASGTVSNAEEDAFQESYLYPADLVVGTNILAVEIHQVSGTSSDISFDLEFVGLTDMPDLMRKGPYLIYAGVNTEMMVNWQLILTDTCTIEWGDDLTYSLGSAETTEYGDDHQHSYTIGGLDPGSRYYYRVTAGSEVYTGSLRAAPSDDAIAVKFMAYGDTRTYPADHDAVAAGIVSEYAADADFQTLILNVGDLVGDGDNEYDWDSQFFDPSYSSIQAMLGDIAHQACMGNHEGSGALYKKYFPYPFVSARYWSFGYGPVHFVVVDQYRNYGPGSNQLAWIESDLASATKPWKIVYLHEPGWSAGHHSNNLSVQNYIQPLCEQYGVSILFAGHNHYYARAVVNGVQHVTTGGGGAPLYDPDLGYPNIVAGTKAHHYCKVEIDGGLLHFSVITAQDSLIDSLTIALPGADITPPDEEPTPADFGLGVAVPNPSSQNIEIFFSVDVASSVSLEIYDVDGRKVRQLVHKELEAGGHGFAWDGKDDAGILTSPGIYFCRLEVEGKSAMTKLVRLK